MTQRKGSIISLLEKAIIILLSSPLITLFACHLGTQLWIAFLAAQRAALLGPGFLSSSHVRWHRLARETLQVSFHSNSQNSVLSSGHYSFKLILGHAPVCALYSIHTKPLAHHQAPRSWTPHLSAHAVPLSLYLGCPSLPRRTVNKHIIALWVPAQSSTLLHPGGSPEAPTGAGGGGDLFLRESVHWVLRS